MGRWIIIIAGLFPGVWSGNWGVTFENQCALKGTSVNLKCNYDYPVLNIITWVGWYKHHLISNVWHWVLLSDLHSPPNHFKYIDKSRGDCSLRVNNVQYSDQGKYRFHFSSTLGSWTSKGHASLEVKDLTLVVQPSTVREGDTIRLTCRSGCPGPAVFFFFKDGRRIQRSQFQARREDAGKYHCAIQGPETVWSATVALSVHYAPKDVRLSASPSGDVVTGSMVVLTCNSEANPAVAQSGYRFYKDGEYVSSGQKHVISDIQPRHMGSYHCQAWNNISWRGSDLINSSEIQLDVRYHPMNVSFSVNPKQIVEGSSANLTCHSEANPAADSYTWYKRTDTVGSDSLAYVGSGQVLSLSFMESSDSGLYVCLARNSVGEANSTGLVLVMAAEQHGSQALPILAGFGVFLVVMLVAVLLLFWRKQKFKVVTNQTNSNSRLSGRTSNSEEPTDAVYSNIQILPSPPGFDLYSNLPPRKVSKNIPRSEDEILYSTVTTKPRNQNAPNHTNSWFKGREDDSSVVYSSVII